MVDIDWWAVVTSTAVRNAAITLASLLTILAVVPKTVPTLVASSRWVWGKMCSLRTRLTVSWRRRRARAIMERNSKIPDGFIISIDAHSQSLSESPATSRRVLRDFFRDGPGWLNDYYVVTAIEVLVAKGCLAKATLYRQDAWPMQQWAYFFRHRDFITSPSVAEEASRIETDSVCSMYQLMFSHGVDSGESCFVGARFEYEGYSQTTSPTSTLHGTRKKLKEGAPPCERCWERNWQERDLTNLVVRFLENELAEAVEPFSVIKEERGTNNYGRSPGPFIGTVVAHIVEAGISVEEIERSLQITRKAVAIHARHCKEQTDGQVNVYALKRELNGAEE